jgi:AraC-like DNA-binding protein
LSAHVLWQKKAPGYKAYVQEKLYHILGLLCESEIISQMPEVFLNAVSYINANYTDNTLNIEKICKNAGINATNLRILFKKHYHKTPTEYITKLRLEYARNLISCGVSIVDAAEESGFNDSKYFARVVKKHFNCAPRYLKSYG